MTVTGRQLVNLSMPLKGRKDPGHAPSDPAEGLRAHANCEGMFSCLLARFRNKLSSTFDSKCFETVPNINVGAEVLLTGKCRERRGFRSFKLPRYGLSPVVPSARRFWGR